VVHRDIKPGNLMACGGRVTLLDMGLARCADPAADEPQLTRHGEVLGTSEYMPPEQWEGKEACAAADLYSLGCTLFFLLTGHPPYAGETSYRQMTQHTSAPVPSVRASRPDVPAALDAVLQRMMAKNPAHRGTARELTWQLKRVLVTAHAPVAAARPAPAEVAPEPESAASSPSVRTGAGRSRPAASTRDALASQTLLTGAGVRPLVREFAAEVRLAVRRLTGRAEAGAVLGATSGRLREVAVELARTLGDGLCGRRPDARGAAWAAVGLAAVTTWLISRIA
jgi:hypothetical protein